MTAIMFPRGIRNNNPGNIRLSKTDWKGEVKGGDKVFETFKTPEDGLRALMLILMTYYTKYRLTTVRAIINRWAPPSENDTEAYIKQVSWRVGVSSDQTIDLLDKGILISIAKGIVIHENGAPPKNRPDAWYLPSQYEEAADRVYSSVGL